MPLRLSRENSWLSFASSFDESPGSKDVGTAAGDEVGTEDGSASPLLVEPIIAIPLAALLSFTCFVADPEGSPVFETAQKDSTGKSSK